MANLWKIGRELRRLRQQVSTLTEAFHEPRTQRRYDARRLDHLALSEGTVPLLAKVALLVIHQPDGLKASTMLTCRHLADQGYAPLVVSNGPLAEADRRKLESTTWKVAERPNYGYDFGGYRDGVLALQDWGIAPETLLILNDSIWFPLYSDSPMLTQLEAVDADIAGTIMRHRVRSGWTGVGRQEISFLESYCYRIGGAAFQTKAFGDFWRDYRMTDNKYKVIRRGERDFSMTMQDAGLRLAALFTEADFWAAVEGSGFEDLLRTVRYGAHADDAIRREQAQIVQDFAATPLWRERALEHVRRACETGVFNSAFCYPTIGQLHADCLKKSAERINVFWRERYLAAVRAGDLQAPAAEIMNELSSVS